MAKAGPSAGGWTRNGTAALSGSTLVLTPPTGGAAGSASWPTPLASQVHTVANVRVTGVPLGT